MVEPSDSPAWGGHSSSFQLLSPRASHHTYRNLRRLPAQRLPWNLTYPHPTRWLSHIPNTLFPFAGHHGPTNPDLHPRLRRNTAPAPPARTRSRSRLLLTRINRRIRVPVDKTNPPSNRLRPHRPSSLAMPHRSGRSRGGRVYTRPGYRVNGV
jgi:hypothetical protein